MTTQSSNPFDRSLRGRIVYGLLPLGLLGANMASAGPEASVSASPADPQQRGFETELDLPADFHRYYGQQVNQWRDNERKIAKLDMDVDMSYDGTIDNEDPADQGGFESTPPGLVLGVGEMSKVVVRVSPYRVDFEGEVVIGLEVVGINRAVRSGLFDSFEEEVASTGRIRIWRDADRTELLLDSADPERRYHEWVADDRIYPANLPGIYPRTFYVEGVSVAGGSAAGGKEVVASGKEVVSPSQGFSGDLRVLMTVSHREKGTPRESYPEYRKRFVKSFRTTFDHFLVTVRNEPHPKDFINSNSEGVWLAPGVAVGTK